MLRPLSWISLRTTAFSGTYYGGSFTNATWGYSSIEETTSGNPDPRTTESKAQDQHPISTSTKTHFGYGNRKQQHSTPDILLMEGILHHLACTNLVNNGING